MEASKKLSWVKSMDAKLKVDSHLQDLARKVADGHEISKNMSKQNTEKFKSFIEDAQRERQKRINKERKKAAAKKEGDPQ